MLVLPVSCLKTVRNVPDSFQRSVSKFKDKLVLCRVLSKVKPESWPSWHVNLLGLKHRYSVPVKSDVHRTSSLPDCLLIRPFSVCY